MGGRYAVGSAEEDASRRSAASAMRVSSSLSFGTTPLATRISLNSFCSARQRKRHQVSPKGIIKKKRPLSLFRARGGKGVAAHLALVAQLLHHLRLHLAQYALGPRRHRRVAAGEVLPRRQLGQRAPQCVRVRLAQPRRARARRRRCAPPRQRGGRRLVRPRALIVCLVLCLLLWWWWWWGLWLRGLFHRVGRRFLMSRPVYRRALLVFLSSLSRVASRAAVARQRLGVLGGLVVPRVGRTGHVALSRPTSSSSGRRATGVGWPAGKSPFGCDLGVCGRGSGRRRLPAHMDEGAAVDGCLGEGWFVGAGDAAVNCWTRLVTRSRRQGGGEVPRRL